MHIILECNWSKWNDSIIIKASSHFLQSELCLKVSTLCKVWYMALQIALSMTNIQKVHLFQYSKLAVPLLKLESKQFKYLKCLPSRLNVEKLNHYSRWHSCYANSTLGVLRIFDEELSTLKNIFWSPHKKSHT